MKNKKSNDTEALLAVIDRQARMQEQLLATLESSQKTTHSQSDSGEQEINLIDIIFSVLRGWWIILLSTVIGAVFMLLYSTFTYVPTYRATAKMWVNSNSISIGTTQVSITAGDINASEALVKVYGEILKTYLVLDQVGVELAKQGYSGFSYENLAGRISCSSVNGTGIFSITVTDTNPERAIDIANTIMYVLPDQISTVIEGSSARTVDRARVAFLNGSGIERKVMIGGVAGFVLSAGLVVLFNYLLNDSIGDPSWLTSSYSDIPLLGEVPNVHSSSNEHYYYYEHLHGNTEAASLKKEEDDE